MASQLSSLWYRISTPPSRNMIIIAVSLVIAWCLALNIRRYCPAIQAGLQSRFDTMRQSILHSVTLNWATHASSDPNIDPVFGFDLNANLHVDAHLYNESKLAILVEPRPLPVLVPQMLHMMAMVPHDWRFLLVGTNQSVGVLARNRAAQAYVRAGRLGLLDLPPPWELGAGELTDRVLTDPRFYDEFLPPKVEWLLKFEADAILCANSKKSLDDYLKWDWVGASKKLDDQYSFRGGLSLRRMSAIRRVLKFQARRNNTDLEDEWFAKRLANMPGVNVATGVWGALAVEDIYLPRPLGFHVPTFGIENDDIWRDQDRRKHIFEYCPELSLVLDMKLEMERCG